MTFGTNQNVYVANASDKEVYVMVSEKPGWIVADVVVDVGLFLVGVGEIKSAVTVAELPEALNTFYDLYKFITIAGKLLSGTISTGSRSTEAALKIIEAFKQNSIRIDQGDVKNVYDQGFLGTFLNASGLSGLAGAETITLTVMSGDGLQVAQFDTGPDYSWIATDNESIVRAKYGSLWQEDPGEGSHEWPIAK